MTGRRAALIATIVLVAGGLAWVLFVGLPRWYAAPATTTVPAPTATAAPEDGRTIKARLFYVSDDGARLTSVERDVPFAEQTAAQARRIIDAQLAPVATPLVSAVPTGTTLRAVYLASDGSAYVDLSREVTLAHPGGSVNELLTIYTIVQALTTNLPAITAVQVLVDGREVDTLAGHVDIKRPLPRNDAWVADSQAAATEPAPATEGAATAPSTSPSTPASGATTPTR